MTGKSLFCSHDWGQPNEATPSGEVRDNFARVRVYTRRGKYRDEGHFVRVCKKCGKRKISGTFGINKSSPEADRIMWDELKKMGLLESYSADQFGSYYYCEFRSELWDILDNEGEEAVRNRVRSALA